MYCTACLTTLPCFNRYLTFGGNNATGSNSELYSKIVLTRALSLENPMVERSPVSSIPPGQPLPSTVITSLSSSTATVHSSNLTPLPTSTQQFPSSSVLPTSTLQPVPTSTIQPLPIPTPYSLPHLLPSPLYPSLHKHLNLPKCYSHLKLLSYLQ